MAAPAPLIAFEGLDQSGKETQARLLRVRLEQAGHRVESLTFPDDTTTLGQEIRAGLGGTRSYPPDVMQLLYIANRHERRETIEGWLADGVVVICDRYLASSVAYGRARRRDAIATKAIWNCWLACAKVIAASRSGCPTG
jgi:dTMP kinase